jgi:hypothetical protein
MRTMFVAIARIFNGELTQVLEHRPDLALYLNRLPGRQRASALLRPGEADEDLSASSRIPVRCTRSMLRRDGEPHHTGNSSVRDNKCESRSESYCTDSRLATSRICPWGARSAARPRCRVRIGAQAAPDGTCSECATQHPVLNLPLLPRLTSRSSSTPSIPDRARRAP